MLIVRVFVYYVILIKLFYLNNKNLLNIYIMHGEYSCQFIKFIGKTCEKSCMREKGSSIYWKYVKKLADKQLIPCIECGKLTRSHSG